MTFILTLPLKGCRIIIGQLERRNERNLVPVWKLRASDPKLLTNRSFKSTPFLWRLCSKRVERVQGLRNRFVLPGCAQIFRLEIQRAAGRSFCVRAPMRNFGCQRQTPFLATWSQGKTGAAPRRGMSGLGRGWGVLGIRTAAPRLMRSCVT